MDKNNLIKIYMVVINDLLVLKEKKHYLNLLEFLYNFRKIFNHEN